MHLPNIRSFYRWNDDEGRSLSGKNFRKSFSRLSIHRVYLLTGFHTILPQADTTDNLSFYAEPEYGAAVTRCKRTNTVSLAKSFSSLTSAYFNFSYLNHSTRSGRQENEKKCAILQKMHVCHPFVQFCTRM